MINKLAKLAPVSTALASICLTLWFVEISLPVLTFVAAIFFFIAYNSHAYHFNPLLGFSVITFSRSPFRAISPMY
ncbi:hypothetical protein [Pseudomonas aeruginosa]|nr:hypothetical protein [Pseudomonas aeruginosa]HCF9077917.1 hypothetical protein [Pseudomonas aeruginosa]HCF9084394.1 hypothetical protein [Pseudomonas aeruginosa]HCF9091051.1 hypothetical protein [Pseudomonas aeruginosa]HCF9097714.1 hypothetical protein [Pseudomonas aeruginosa]|tara:strand:+ start:1008 stop:1232 length:225 start_codon:yes stop_codon:yes gene_type:complete